MGYSEEQLAQWQEETNEIIEKIESQKLDDSTLQSFVYALFAIVGISMIFEFFVKKYREEKRTKKKKGEPLNNIRGKLLITYGIHVFTLLITWLVCDKILHFTSIYTGALITVAVFIVEIAPLFTLHLDINLFKKEDKNDTPQ